MRNLKLNIKIIFSIILLFSIYAVGSSGEGSTNVHEEGIPKVVYYQALNFFGVLFLIGFFLRKKLANFFNNRHEQLKTAVRESQRLKNEVQKRHEEYSLKLQSISSETNSILEKIKNEGNIAKEKLINEAQKNAEIIEREARLSVDVEIAKAKKQLFEETLEKSLNKAKALLKSSVLESDQKTLQQEFREKMGSLK